MTTAVIVSTARTGLAKSWRGAFNLTHGATMGGHALQHAMERAGLAPAEVDDVVMGCALPEGATGFTTIELKSNFLGTAREGTIDCIAKATHLGRTTQLWDAIVTHREAGKTIALFRCTQLLIYPKGRAS